MNKPNTIQRWTSSWSVCISESRKQSRKFSASNNTFFSSLSAAFVDCLLLSVWMSCSSLAFRTCNWNSRTATFPASSFSVNRSEMARIRPCNKYIRRLLGLHPPTEEILRRFYHPDVRLHVTQKVLDGCRQKFPGSIAYWRGRNDWSLIVIWIIVDITDLEDTGFSLRNGLISGYLTTTRT